MSQAQRINDPAPIATVETLPTTNKDLLRDRAISWARRYGAISTLVILVLVAQVFSSNFLTGNSIRGQLQSFCLSWALIAVGQTLVILTQGIDLSVGSLL